MEQTHNHINNLKKFMLTEDLINNIINPRKNEIKENQLEQASHTGPTEKNHIIKKVETSFIPEQKDTLFWCYYIIKNGFSAYEYPGATSYSNEKAEKFKCVDLLRLHKQQLKTNKIKNLKEHVEDELANRDRIGMKTFIALCIVSGINILFIHRRKCFESIHNEEEVIHVVHMLDSKYSYESEVTPEQVEYYRNNLFKWESVDKPLKAISSYKSEELVDLCKKLDLGTDFKKKTKKDLYELIIMNL